MKKSISNRDVERIANHAELPAGQVRLALAMRGDVAPDTVRRIMESARALRYTITARDRVAMAADTSVATVNRAYRPDARHLVRPDLLRTIQQEADRLGYTPDLVAQARRSHGSPIVALCVEIDYLSNPYHSRTLFHLMEAFLQRRQHPVITPIVSGTHLPELAQSGVTNTIVLWDGPHTPHQVRLLSATGRKAVLIGRHAQLPSVAPDWSMAYEQLTRHALTSGYDWLHLGYFSPDYWGPGARLEGVARALARHEGAVPQLRLWIDPALDSAAAVRKLSQLGLHEAADLFETMTGTPGALEPRAARKGGDIVSELIAELEQRCNVEHLRVAVLGLSDMTARLLLHAIELQHPEWTIGENVGLVGYDNIEPLLTYLDPVLSTVAYDLKDMAERVADAALTEPHKADGPASFSLLPTTVIARKSL